MAVAGQAAQCPAPARRPVREALERWLVARAMALEPIGDIADVSLTESTTTPLPTTNLNHQYDAQALSGYSGGDTVSSFTDSHGSNDANTVNGDPKYRASEINGNPVVEYDGDDDHQASNPAPTGGSGTYTFAGVFRINSIPGIHMLYENGLSGGGFSHGYRDDSGTLTWDLYHQGRAYQNSGSTSPQPSTGTNFDFIGTYDGSTASLYVNGTNVLNASISIGSPSGNLALASRGGTRYGQHDIGEYLFYSDHKDSSQRSTIRSYFSDKWGV